MLVPVQQHRIVPTHLLFNKLDRRVCIPKHNVLVMFSMSLRFSVLNFTICRSFTDDESSKNCIASPSFSILLKMSFPKLLATYFLSSDKRLSLTDFNDGQISRKCSVSSVSLWHRGHISFSWFFVNFALSDCKSWLLVQL